MKQTKNEKQNDILKDIYNLYAVLMTMFVSALGGFGMFWFGQIFGVLNPFVNIFFGMMFSAGLYNAIKFLYPIKK
jgi:hypothetical protein